MAVATAIADLRHRRRELRRELARVRWWRQLVSARRELTIAHMARATDSDPDLDNAWEALAADAPTPAELAAAIWPESVALTARSVEVLSRLDARLEVYESRLSDNLEGVTTRMVDAMGATNRTEAGHAT